MKRMDVYCQSIMASIKKEKKYNKVLSINFLPHTFQIQKICILKSSIFPAGQICGYLLIGKVYQGVVKINYMFKVYNKTAVGLEETVFGKMFHPVIHIFYRNKILQSGV